ncbi:hypothetical protein CDL15_Pgr018410 [Punica granatum]|uniref:Uncharacterized protein n=1 Tax=Punica granatum TaxID=22663 RepID=A0A218WYX5_PUNGR|nr:hypothetical protein CDL15_Pgr018410 [Punica granatum]
MRAPTRQNWGAHRGNKRDRRVWSQDEENALLDILEELVAKVRHCREIDSDDVWKAYCKKDPNAATLRGKTYPLYDRLALIFGKDRAKGNLSEDPFEENAAVDDEEQMEQMEAMMPCLLSTVVLLLRAQHYGESASRLDKIAFAIGHAKDIDNKEEICD